MCYLKINWNQMILDHIYIYIYIIIYQIDHRWIDKQRESGLQHRLQQSVPKAHTSAVRES